LEIYSDEQYLHGTYTVLTWFLHGDLTSYQILHNALDFP